MRRFIVIVCLVLYQITGFGSSNIRFQKISLKDGLSQSSINKVIQDKDGFIWIGTQDGLNKFDGYTIETYYYNPKDSNSLSNNYIQDLYQDQQGFLWFATDYGLNRYDPSQEEFIRFYDFNSNLPNNAVKKITEDNQGNLIVVTSKGILSRYDKKSNRFEVLWKSKKKSEIQAILCEDNQLYFGTNTGDFYVYNLVDSGVVVHDRIGTSINALYADHSDQIWVGTSKGLFTAKGSENIIRHQTKTTIDNQSITSMYINGESFWLGTQEGLIRYLATTSELITYKPNEQNEYSISHSLIQTIYKDQTGNLWVGTNNGLNRFDIEKRLFEHYSENSSEVGSIVGSNVWSMYKDSQGYLWVGTRKGINIQSPDLHESVFIDNISNSKAFINNKSVMAIYEDHKNTMYVGAVDGLYEVSYNESRTKYGFTSINYNDSIYKGRLENRVYIIFEDKKHRLWIGTKNGLAMLSKDRKTNKFFTTSNGLPHNTIRHIAQTKDGTIWFGSEGGLCKLIDFTDKKINLKVFTNELSNPSSISNNMVISILDDGTNLWLGTYGGGLNRFDKQSEKFESITQEQGLSNNVVYGVLKDARGTLWMSTNKGVSNYDPSTKAFYNYFENDGLQSNEFNIGAFFQDKKGRIYFGGINGFNCFLPTEVITNTSPPKMALTAFKLSNQEVEIGEHSVLKRHINNTKTIELNYRHNDFTIEFAALHYSYPAKNQYQYKMVGFDENWKKVGTQRFAHYTNLDAGEYTFIVKGSNSDGVWSEDVASINIIITPPFWETWVFRVSFVLFVLGLVVFIYKYRVKQIEEQKEVLEETVAQRTAEVMKQKEKLEEQKKLLEEEKEKSEKLLLNILPQETVEELKFKGKASARHYKLATVLFTDFKGFTKISAKMRPQEVVERLDAYFVKYDEIIERNGLEKIKTIGDSYMCAGGVPIRNKTNPINAVLAGLEIQRYMADLRKRSKDEKDVWGVRIGIHTGEVIAGVIGIKRFAYDVWGDTVNVASRMETAGEVDKVNISGQTYKQIKHYFICDRRGELEAKNKGKVEMYFVKGIKPELSINQEGVVPNDLFWEMVNLDFYSDIDYRSMEKFIINKMRTEIPENMYYHNAEHVISVCDSVTRIALEEGVKGQDLFLLRTAALYHDIGFVERYENNEVIAARIAGETLPQFGYNEEQIEIVQALILATKIPHKPKNLLEEIICDGDLDYLGTEQFFEHGDGQLRREFIEYGVVENDAQWEEIQIKFLMTHKYFTSTAIKSRRARKLEHLDFVQQRQNNNA